MWCVCVCVRGLVARIRCISGCNCETLLIYANLADAADAAARFVQRQ